MIQFIALGRPLGLPCVDALFYGTPLAALPPSGKGTDPPYESIDRLANGQFRCLTGIHQCLLGFAGDF